MPGDGQACLYFYAALQKGLTILCQGLHVRSRVMLCHVVELYVRSCLTCAPCGLHLALDAGFAHRFTLAYVPHAPLL